MSKKMISGPSNKSSGLSFNHAMVYSRDVTAAIRFYSGLLGFEVLEEVRGHDITVYARLSSPRGNATIALHLVEPDQDLRTGGVRLYFEVKDLERFCERLESAGAKFSQKPKRMPWGWDHAYLDDPDGHEVSLYWAGAKRLQRSGPAKSGKTQ